MKRKGLTLIELLLTVSIISILLVITMPKLKVVERIKVKNDIKNIYTNINKCRNLAISTSRETTIDFQSKGQYTYSFKGKNVVVKYSPLINISDYSNKKKFKFTKRGVAGFDGSGTIIFTTDICNYKITVEPVTGKVNLYEENLQ